MGTIVTESNQGGGLHGRMTVELKKAFFASVKEHLKDRGYPEAADKLSYSDLFTLRGGTSFGTLMTVAMSPIGDKLPVCRTPSEFGTLIDAEAKKIFPYSGNVLHKLFNNPRQLLSGVAATTKFSNKYITGLLQDLLGKNTHVSDVKDDILITMAQLNPVIDTLFAKSHVARGEETEIDKNPGAHKDWLLWQAALASASPTTIFPGVEMTNRAGTKTVGVVDGGQSGWNDPAVPVIAEATFMFGHQHDDLKRCLVADVAGRGYKTDHDIIHISWGTGDFHESVKMQDVKANTVLAIGSDLVRIPMQAAHKYGLVIGSGQIQEENFFRFDIDISALPEEIRPENDFTLSSNDQMAKLRAAGAYSAQQQADKINKAAEIVAQAYIERMEFEKKHNFPYKEYLNGHVCPIP